MVDSSDKEERTTPVVPSPTMSGSLLLLGSGVDLLDMAGLMFVSNQLLFLLSRSLSLPPPLVLAPLTYCPPICMYA